MHRWRRTDSEVREITMNFIAKMTLVFLALTGAFGGRAVDAATPNQIQWLRVSDRLLSGNGLDGTFDMAKMGQFIDWVENKQSKAIYKAAYLGQLRVNVIETSGNAVHLPDFPNDELIYILVGGLTLTADSTKIDQTFYAGDRILVPKGWSGVWRVHAGVYREIALTPSDYYDGKNQSRPLPKSASVLVVDPPNAPGTRLLYRGAYIVEAQNADGTETRSFAQQSDEVVHILRGTLTLRTANKSAIFKPGDIVIVPRGFTGESQVSAAYRAVIVRAEPRPHA